MMVEFTKKHYILILEIGFLIGIFFLSQLPLRDFDIWFHLKSGEVFTQRGVIHYDPFSHTAGGREWIAHEWLFGYVSYHLNNIFGMQAIQYMVALFFTLTVFCFIKVQTYIFKTNTLQALFFATIFWISIYEFNTARPHPIAYSLIALTILLLLTYIYKGKKWIYGLPLATLLWVNIHSSNFLSWGLILAYIVVLFITWLLKHEKKVLLQIRTLGIVAIANALVTITPPMGIHSYKLVWQFSQQTELLGRLIAEWVPTFEQGNSLGFITLGMLFTLAVISLGIYGLKTKKWSDVILFLPLLFMGFMGFVATRNVYLSSFALLLINSWALTQLTFKLKKLHILLILLPIYCVIGIFYGTILFQKWDEIRTMRLNFPVHSVEFAKKYLKGNMFNDYTYGGYVLYHTYPNLKVFIDGRADVYLCCEVHDYMLLAYNKNLSDDEYRKFLHTYFNEYKIDFAIVTTQKHNVMRKISRLLNTDPDWALVFWDDSSQVFVKRNGKNNEIINKLDTRYATPYLQNPFVKGKQQEALEEYIKQDEIVKTARTSNAIGYIYLLRGNYDEAQNRFEEAILIDPTFESAYMNRGELFVKDGNLERAIAYYTKAQSLAPDRGLIYIRLGQLYLEGVGDTSTAKEIWENGVKNTVDEDAKKELEELLRQNFY